LEQGDGQQRKSFNVQAVSPSPDPTVPDVYADGVTVQAGYAGFTLIFTRSMGDVSLPATVGIVRMSPQQSLVMTQLLRKILKSYEDDIGKISVPDELFESLEIEREL
jgi:hypothetical protein